MDTTEYKDLFISESIDYLDSLNHLLLSLEKKPDDPSSLDELFRALHTLKGMAASMEYDDIMELTHQMETVFDRYRTLHTAVPQSVIDVIFQCVDMLYSMVHELSASNATHQDVLPLIQKLNLLVN